MIYLCGKSRWR